MRLAEVAIAVVIALAVAAPAMAQQQFTLSVTPDEAQMILNILGEKPWRDINPVMSKLIGQINAQSAAVKAPPKEEQK